MKTIGTLMLALLATVPAWSQAVKTVEVHAKKYEFVPAEITIKKGETVKLELVSDDVAHSLRMDQLDLNVRMPARETVETTITPAQTGDFRGRCGVYCGAGHEKMYFTIHVVDGR